MSGSGDSRAAGAAATVVVASPAVADVAPGGRRDAVPRGRSASGDERTGPSPATRGDTWRWLLVAFLGYAGFAAIAILVAARVVMPFDAPILAVATGWVGSGDVWRLLSDSANLPLIVIGVAIILWLLAHRHFGEALLVLLVLAAATVGSEAVKELVHRPRPSGTDPHVIGVVYSFPSGHTLEAATIYGIIGMKTWRSSRPLLLRGVVVVTLAALVVLVGVARMALNAHYPSDVLAGLGVGIGDLAVYGWFTRPGRANRAARTAPA